MRFGGYAFGGVAAAFMAGAAFAQVAGVVPERRPDYGFADARGASFPLSAPEAAFGGDFRPAPPAAASLVAGPSLDRAGLTGSETRETWVTRPDGTVDRVRVTLAGPLRGADGAPLPLGPMDRASLEVERYDVSYVRGWPALRSQSGELQIELTPHAGVGVTSEGGSAEAGATLRIGENLTVRDGQSYGDAGRWYVFAAGTGRAVGMNFLPGENGRWTRAGMSHDAGSFIGDAQVGVAWRRGPLQASFGYVHREIEAEGMRGEGFDRDQTEGLVAFQLSIRPQR